MSELRELYQELIVEHGRKPRNFRALEGANRRSEGLNPLCGDEITLYLRLDGDVIGDAAFTGSGCAISKASASLMTSALKGRSRSEAEALFERFHGLVTGRGPAEDGAALGKLVVFAGVRDFPARVKCASLPWHALLAALRGEGEAVSTE